MTNAEKILALLSKSPGLDDDELSSHANIRPRQQVNQICRRLESKGLIERVRGPHGKIVNSLLGSSKGNQIPSSADSDARGQPKIKECPKALPSTLKQDQMNAANIKAICDLDRTKTLILIPCSGKKAEPVKGESKGPSIVDPLPAFLRKDLFSARSRLADKANLDENTLIPAWRRYTGILYESAESALESTLKHGLKIVIISGGYGLLIAEEPIGTYDLAFKTSNWPMGLLEDVLITYIESCKLENVVAFVSASTGYRQLLERVNWSKTPLKNVFLVMPEATTGAMRKAPKAQGEALSSFLDGSLNSTWESSDGLRLMAVRKTQIPSSH